MSSSTPRAKPLRTYSKRSATPSRGEAPAKKRRVSADDTPNEGSPVSQKRQKAAPSSTPAREKDVPKSAPSPATAPEPLKKSSILNYFKLLPPATPVTSSSPNSDELERASTPPSSPPPSTQTQARRKPRILRFRGTSMPSIDTDEEEAKGGKEDGEAEVGDDNRRHDDDSEEELKDGTNKEPSRPALQYRQGSVSNQVATSPVTDESSQKKKTKKPAQTVQTTLNISNQAPFSECKVCNTVWNPLYPDDVKFHTKQHAAALRAKQKAKENEL